LGIGVFSLGLADLESVRDQLCCLSAGQKYRLRGQKRRLSRLHRRIAVPPEISRAEVADLSICSLTSEIGGSTLRINNSLKRNGISSRFRTELAVLYN